MSSRNVPEVPTPAVSLRQLAADLREHLQEVLDLNGMGGFLWDLDSGLVHVDPSGLAVLGVSPDEFDGRMSSLESRVPQQDLNALRTEADEALTGEDGHGAYFRARHPDGELRWAHIQAHVQRDGTGRPHRVFGFLHDAAAELHQVTRGDVQESVIDAHAGTVSALTAVLAQALTVQDVIAALTDEEMLGLIGASGASLSIVEDHWLRRHGSRGIPLEFAHDLEWQNPDVQLLGAVVLRTRTPLFVNGRTAPAHFKPFWEHAKEEHNMSRGVVLPLIAQAQPIGVLVLAFPGEEEFTLEERNLLLALSSAVAQSVQRALLYDQDHAMAIGLQAVLLPARIPEVPGARIAVRYRPAGSGHQLGGDWYDVVPLPDDRVGLVVGDVEGRDIHASAVMGQLRTALRAYAAEGHSPGDLMVRASAFLRDLDTDRSAVCLYAELDPLSGDIRFVGAGHLRPLIGRTDGSAARQVIASGPPFGLPAEEEAPYRTTRLRLRRGETLVLCTDGPTEPGDAASGEGVRRIEAALRGAPDDLESVAERIIATTAEKPEPDDAVLIVVALDNVSPEAGTPTEG